MRLKAGVALTMLSLLTACGARYVHPNQVSGQPVDAVIERWGPPVRTATLTNGDISYAWHLATMSVDGSVEYFCNVNAVATHGMIYRVTWSGNWCRR